MWQVAVVCCSHNPVPMSAGVWMVREVSEVYLVVEDVGVVTTMACEECALRTFPQLDITGRQGRPSLCSSERVSAGSGVAGGPVERRLLHD